MVFARIQALEMCPSCWKMSFIKENLSLRPFTEFSPFSGWYDLNALRELNGDCIL